MGEPTQRAFATALTKAGTETYKEFLMPQQLAIDVSDAAEQLAHDFRASLEHSRDHILFVLDAKDAFQTVKRSVVLERMSKITGLEAQTTFWVLARAPQCAADALRGTPPRPPLR